MKARDRVRSRLQRLGSSIAHYDVGWAETGKFDPVNGGLYSDPAYELDTGFIWVRRGGSRNSERARNPGNVAPLDSVNESVIVGKSTLDGELEVIAPYFGRAIPQHGENVYNAFSTRRVVRSRDLEPGRVYLASAGTLTFRAKPFLFTDTDGDRREWLDTLADTVTASVTAASGEHQVIVIAANPDATTPALTATNGTAVSTSVSLTRENALAVTLTDGYIPLAALHVYNGDTTPRGEDYIWDLRPWLEGSGNGGTASPLTTKGDLYTYDTDNARLALGTNGQYLRARPSETTGLAWESAAVGNGLTVTKATRQTHIQLFYDELASSGRFDVDLTAITNGTSCRHLIIRGALRTDAGSSVDQTYLFVNNDTTASNYRFGSIYGGAGEGGDEGDTPIITTASVTASPANYFTMFEGIVYDYRNTSHEKRGTFQNYERRLTNQGYAHVFGWSWESTAAINRVTIQPDGYATNSFVAGSWLEIVGVFEEDVVTDVSGGMAEVSTDNVSNPPTDAELDTAFGTPAALGAGFVGLVNDGGADTTVWLAMSTGAKWFYASMTEAT